MTRDDVGSPWGVAHFQRHTGYDNYALLCKVDARSERAPAVEARPVSQPRRLLLHDNDNDNAATAPVAEKVPSLALQPRAPPLLAAGSRPALLHRLTCAARAAPLPPYSFKLATKLRLFAMSPT